MNLTANDIPLLKGPTLADAKEWFAAMRPHSSGAYLGGWHADDPLEQPDGYSSEAFDCLKQIIASLMAGAQAWADPDVICRLVADDAVPAEAIWPGFDADIEIGAGRLGYVSLPDRARPNFVLEEYSGEFYLIEFEAGKPISQCNGATMFRIEGVGFDSANGNYVEVQGARVLEDTKVFFEDVRHADHVIATIHDRSVSPMLNY